MGIVYAFFADKFKEIEALATIDTLRRAGLDVKIVSVTSDEIVIGAHDVSVFCDKNFKSCDFFDAELLFLPGGMPDAATLDKHEGVRRLILNFVEKNRPTAAIYATPVVLGRLGLPRGRRTTYYPSLEQYLESAECTNEPVVRDGNTITSMGPDIAIEFALTIVDALLGKEKTNKPVETMCIRR